MKYQNAIARINYRLKFTTTGRIMINKDEWAAIETQLIARYLKIKRLEEKVQNYEDAIDFF